MHRAWPFTLVLLAACFGGDEEQPGESFGVFEASGLMVEQSCGSAVPATDPIDLDFEIRTEAGGRAYWRTPGGPIFAGVKSGDEYTFTTSSSYTVIQPDRFRGYVGCSVTQRDTFTVILEEVEADETPESDATEDATVMPALYAVSGSQRTDIVPLAGADCTPAVISAGGPFLAMPCRVEYVLTGSGVSTVPPEVEPTDE